LTSVKCKNERYSLIKSVRTAEEITNKMYYITHPFAKSILENKICAKRLSHKITISNCIMQ
jgi:hypothetical protein